MKTLKAILTQILKLRGEGMQHGCSSQRQIELYSLQESTLRYKGKK